MEVAAYRDPDIEQGRPWPWLGIALACALLPMGVGVVVFLLWWITDAEALYGVGALVILGGTVLFFVGAAAVLTYVITNWVRPHVSRSRTIKRALGVMIVLLANFPLALVLGMAALAIGPRFVVVVDNQGTTPITGAIVDLGRANVPLGTIPPGKRMRRRFRNNAADHIELDLPRNGQRVTIEGLSYIDSDVSVNRITFTVTDSDVQVDEQNGY